MYQFVLSGFVLAANSRETHEENVVVNNYVDLSFKSLVARQICGQF